jgi:hypothetical protein
MSNVRAWKLFGCLAVVVLALTAQTPAAVAQDTAPPQNVQGQVKQPAPCDIEPSQRAAETLSLAPHTTQPQKNWQRQGKDVDVTIVNVKVPANSRVVACFRWALQDWKVPGAKDYEIFEKTAFVPANADAKTNTVTAAITVPTLKERPKSPAVAKSGEPTGIYGRNGTYANAEVRVFLYGDADTPIAALSSIIGVVEADNYCDIPGQETTTGSGIGSLEKHKNWQPVGGVFNFGITSSKIIPPDALVKVCFRWKLKSGDPGRYSDARPPLLVDSKPRNVEIAATVPEIPHRPSWFSTATADSNGPARRIVEFAVLGVAVPRADARILIFDSDSSPIVDVITVVGITQFWFAGILVIAAMVLITTLLWWVCSLRLSDISRSKPLLCLITTRRGFASLSQFQIVLWTFVVLASVIYVIALSGDLIEITTGTLVLLGISGTATVVAKAKSESDDKKPVAVPDPIAATEDYTIAQYEADQLANEVAKATTEEERENRQGAADEAAAKAAKAKATLELADAMAAAVQARTVIATAQDDAKKAALEKAQAAADAVVLDKKKNLAIASAYAAKIIRIRHPSWSDLVMEEYQGRELDVTRVQMLCFTIVSAVFVLLSVTTNFVIPEIPNGYLVLMGISNGVYVTSKFAAKN